MTFIDITVLLASSLLLLGIASSKFSARLGLPVLALFLALGMLAGSEGLGGIPFEDYRLAHDVGSVALALILFDGGLRTSLSSVRSAWRPALVLSTVGVLVTSALTGIVATVVLGIPLLHGMLLGGIVGSTDAAAVFSVLRSGGLRLPERLAATLEVESGSNDPMAIFVTLGLIGLITGTADTPGRLVLLFVLQFGVGTAVGLAIGRLAGWAVNQIHLDARGLYPLLVLSFGLLAFGLSAALEGSGFLAAYLAGIVLGNSRLVFRQGICLFHDAAAWLSQIVLFVMLGLLSFPSRLLAVGSSGLLIALALVFVARPLAVGALLAPFRFPAREIALLAWGGLKGAVPITLATFPLLAGVEGSALLFDAVFFVVLLSALAQGWSLPLVARALRLGRPMHPAPSARVEVHALRHLDGDIVDYTVIPEARIAGRALRELALPDGVAVTLVLRGDEVIVPRGSTILHPGDHVFIALRNRLKSLIDQLFEAGTGPLELAGDVAVAFDSRSTLGQLHRFWGYAEPENSERPVTVLLEAAGGARSVRLGPLVVVPHESPELVTLVRPADGEPMANAERTREGADGAG